MLKSMKLILHSKSEYVKGTCHIYEAIDIKQCLSIIHQCLLHPPPLLWAIFFTQFLYQSRLKLLTLESSH